MQEVKTQNDNKGSMLVLNLLVANVCPPGRQRENLKHHKTGLLLTDLLYDF